MTTSELARTLKAGAAEYNNHVAQAQPVHYPSRELPIDPYVLGAWLGDDTSTTAEITSVDEPILRELVVAGDKHIPREYLESSVEQRRALLEGIMDRDGYVDVYSRCDVTTVNDRLAAGYQELIASLGYEPVVAEKRATLYGRDSGERYEVQFTPRERVFRLPHKVARQKLLQRFKLGRAITSVTPCETTPVRCVQVGSADGVFLVSRSFIPTHNSSLGRLGLIVHATAGFCDPGWKGTLTLELNNLTRVPIKLYPGLRIAQLSFMTLDRPALRPYGSPDLGSHYQGQRAATESRYEGEPTKPRPKS